MIARIAVKNVGGVFDYSVRQDMEQGLAPGIRVIVPLGRGNTRAEGIVVELCETSEYGKLKEIIKIIDQKPLCTPELVELAGWMKDRCFCEYYTALKTVMPSGIAIKKKKIITLNDGINIEGAAGRSKARRTVLDKLLENGGAIEYGDVSGLSAGINELVKMGAVTVSESGKQSVKSKTVRMVVLKAPQNEIEDIIRDTLKRAPVQAKMLEILCQATEIPSADLVSFSGGSNSALTAIVKKGYADFEDRIVRRDAYDPECYERTQPLQPTPEQQQVLKQLKRAADMGDTAPYLLHGVTGSGKTEVFLQIIDYIMKKGKQAIVLVPEISLTPQMVERFVGRFGKSVSVLHSSLSLGERYDEWQRILNKEVSLVVGARSAVFAPFDNLGIIILDEEQENTYKSESNPLYHARDVAHWRAKKNNAILLLASATPSVESYYNAEQGNYKLLEMKRRYNNAIMPKVEIVDMCAELKEGNRSVFSNLLREQIGENILNDEQTILFLNRRGYNTFVSCRSCGDAIKCRNCDVTMTYHKKAAKLVCHYCGFETPIPEMCPSCNSPYIRYFGDGTQKIEEEISTFFNNATHIRMDMDTTSNKNSHEAILNRFRNEKINILIGTQMVTKGLDFKDVTLVGVMAADLSLNMGDYRAYERTFSLLTQVCGRAGRGDIEGRAIIQTYQPDNFVIQLAKEHDYKSFYENEIAIRERLNYPPYCDLVMILATGEDEDKVSSLLSSVVRELIRSSGLRDSESGQINNYITSPVPAPLSRLKGRYRWRTLIKTKNLEQLAPGLHNIISGYGNTDVKITVDINPNSIL